MQPLGVDHATIPRMKAMYVPFHLVYSSLICAKGLQNNRPKCWASLVDPRGYQNMVIKYLSVNIISYHTTSVDSYQQVALIILFQMKYDSTFNSKKQPNDSPRSWISGKSSTTQYRTLWSVTPKLLVADQATIPHMKGNVYSYNIRYGSMICC